MASYPVTISNQHLCPCLEFRRYPYSVPAGNDILLEIFHCFPHPLLKEAKHAFSNICCD